MMTVALPQRTRPQLELPFGGRPVALVVHADSDTRTRIAAILRGDGWQVYQAQDAEHAICEVREYVPDLVLLDVALPRMSGLELLRKMKSWVDGPQVVVVSFYVMLMRREDLALADGVVQTPFAAEDLLQVARSVRPWRIA